MSDQIEFAYACPPVNSEIIKKIGYNIDPKEGSVQMPCIDCNELAWVGPAQLEKMKTAKGPVICFVCYLSRIAVGKMSGHEKIIPLEEKGHGYNHDETKSFGA